MIKLNYIFSFIFAFTSLLAGAQIDRSEAPEPGPAPKIELGEYESFELANGLKVFVVSNPKSPSVSMQMFIDRDPIKELNLAGYISLAGSMIGQRTESKSKEQLAEKIDFIGASLFTSSRSVYASSLKKHLNTLLPLYSDVILNPNFVQEDLDQLKKQSKSSIAASNESPSAIAGRVMNTVLYPNLPYSDVETEETIDNIELSHIQAYYDKYFIPNRAYLAIVGNTTVDEVKPMIEKYFGNWEKGEKTEIQYRSPKNLAKPKVVIVNRPSAVQSTIRIGHAINLQPGTEEVIKARVTNTVLGGGAFRLFKNLREDKAYTYGAYSRISPDEVAGKFIASAEVRNSVTDSAITEILKEMKRLREEKVPEEELQLVKNYLNGDFAIDLENARTIATYAINTERYDLPEDYYQNYLKRLNEVDQEAVMQAANDYIMPDNCVILAVGNAAEIADKLKKFGEIEYRDTYGKIVDAPTQPIPEGLTADDVINSYIEAAGGRKTLEKVKSYKTVYKGSMGENEIVINSYQRKPNLYKQTFSVMGMTQTTKFDGEKGRVLTPRGNQDMDVAQNKKMAATTHLFYLTDYKELGVDAKLKSMETMNGQKAYHIRFSMGEETEWSVYFSVESGLKIAESETQETPQGDMTTTTYLDDYEEHGGIMFPGTLTVSMMGRKISLNLEEVSFDKIKKKVFKLN